MKRYTPLLLLTLISCGVRLDYLGSSFSPTGHVDVFVDASAIKKPYTIIGRGYIDYGPYAKSRIERMQSMAVKTAKEKGANAILFQDYYLKHDGTSIQALSKTDSLDKGPATVPTGAVGPVISAGQNIFFLRYD